MTEKQRVLLQDVEAWKKRQLERLGLYSPKRGKEPASVREARREAKRWGRIIERHEARQKQAWVKVRSRLMARAESTRRTIIFEKTAAALKAVNALTRQQ